MPNFATQPPQPRHSVLSFPAPHVILVTLNRTRDLNCINAQGHADLDAVWQWMDEEPSLRVGILTGQGRAFCAGADLKGNRSSSDLNFPSFTMDLDWASKKHEMHRKTSMANRMMYRISS